MRYPVAYIRRSNATTNDPGDVSRETQEVAVRDLAHRDGHNGNLRVFVDWDRSADEAKEAKRLAFNEMVKAIEGGEVTVVYAYALDRIYRSMRTFVRLTDAAKAHNTRVVTLREGVLGGDGSPMAQAFAQITAVFSELELNTAKARANGGIASRRRRGDTLGQPPYGWRFGRAEGRLVLEPDPAEPVEPVIAAVLQAGSFSGGARILNAAGFPARRADLWCGKQVANVAHKSDPETWPAASRPGRRSGLTWTFAKLLRCPCGGLMTARRNRVVTPYGRFGPYVGYQCAMARYDAAHARPYIVSERALLPFVKAETAHLRTPGAVTLDAPDLEAERADLEARRDRILDMYELHDIERDEYQRRMVSVRERLAAVERRAEAETILPVPPAIDWETWTPAKLNVVLRALFDHIQLGEDLRPLPHPKGFAWTIPEWRAD